MTNHFICRLLALVFALLIAGALHAQAEQTPEKLLDEPIAEPAEEPAEESEEADDSREVDFNEENFRRSMELRDQQLQRSPDLTTGTYSQGTVHQLLEDLPEASQKHLREQLREVIVQNGPWTPEQAGEVYPYTPSDEAMKNGSLEKREQAAWQELVGRYHEREAANRGLSQAGQPGEVSESGEAGQEGEEGQSIQGQQAGTQGSEGDATQQAAERAAARAAALAEIMNSSDAAGAETVDSSAPPTTQGVSQNALQLLTERQQIPAAASSAATASSAAAADAEKSQGQAKAEEAEMDLDTEGVIAIEDLKKVDLETEDSKENQPR